MARLEIALLGSFRVTLDGKAVTQFETDAARLLLSYLVMHAGNAISREFLADLFYPEQSRSQALHTLRQTLCRVRRALCEREYPSDFVLVTPQSLEFNPQSDYWLDVSAFRGLIANIHHHPHQRLTACHSCMRQLIQAAELYRGEFLDGLYLESLPFQEWCVIERESLHRQAMEVFYQLAEFFIQQQEYEIAQHYARRQLENEPWREEAHQQLMKALAASGQRSAALAQYRLCRQILLRDLEVEPERKTRHLFEQIRSGTFSCIPPHNLPTPPTNFVGRALELEQISACLNTPGYRLITLSGPGGIGKTRLALELGKRLLPYYPDGVWFVSLGEISDARQVVPTAASVFQIREDSRSSLLVRLAEYLRNKSLLLILDNCEHLAEAVNKMIETVLQSAPRVQILATSRKVLGAAGEVVYPVTSLSVPEMSTLSVLDNPRPVSSAAESESRETLQQCDSVAFFVDRASAVSPSFALNRENAFAIGQICHLLDGIPLALELAAAHTPILAPQEIVTHLKDTLWLLTQRCPTSLPRHQTLQATLDWSYSLLTPEEQVLLRRLSVFVGSFTLEAAVSVCSDTGLERNQVAKALTGLVNTSLVEANPFGEVKRLRLHEVTRQYAYTHLAASGEENQVRKRHLEFFCHFAESLEGNLLGELPPGAFDRINQDYGNLQAALEWSLQETGEPQWGLRLAAALPNFWEAKGHFAAERTWLEQLIAKAGETSMELRAKALRGAGRLAYYQCDLDAARTFFEQSAALDRQFGNPLRLADTLGRLGFVFSVQQEYRSAESLYQESLALFRELGDQSGIARILSELGYIAFRQGEYAQARSLLEESLRLFQQPADLYLISRAKMLLGHIARREEDYAQAHSHYAAAILVLKDLNNTWGIFYLLEAFALLAIAEGQMERATRLFAASEHLGKSIGTRLAPSEQIDHEGGLAAARTALGEMAFDHSWNAGQAMTPAEAISYALT